MSGLSCRGLAHEGVVRLCNILKERLDILTARCRREVILECIGKQRLIAIDDVRRAVQEFTEPSCSRPWCAMQGDARKVVHTSSHSPNRARTSPGGSDIKT